MAQPVIGKNVIPKAITLAAFINNKNNIIRFLKKNLVKI